MPEHSHVLVTGATGTTGSALVRLLADDGWSVRRASRTDRGAAAGDWVQFDWMDETTHAAALDGVDSMYLIPPALVADPSQVMTGFIERAVQSGVRRVVLLSASAIPQGTPGVGAVHAAIGGIAPQWAVLQPTWFQQNFIDDGHHYAASIRREGRIYTATRDGRVPFVDARDIAAVAFRALTDREPHDRAHVITGPRAMTYNEAAEVITRCTGRATEHVAVAPEEAARRMVDTGMSPEFAQVLAQLEAAIGEGAEDRVTSTVRETTGRTAGTLENLLQQQAAFDS